MRDIGNSRDESALHVPTTAVSVTMLAAGTIFLCALAYAGLVLDGPYAAATSHVLLRYALPAGAIAVILVTLSMRRRLQDLETAQRQLSEREADARYLAMHHAVSQLPNRRYFIQLLRERLRAGRNDPARPQTCLLLIRIDSFKDLADASGHGAADALATQIGPRLIPLLKPGDLLAHLAGELFAIVCDIESAEGIGAFDQAVTAALGKPFDTANGPIRISVSLSPAIAAPGELDPERMVQEAGLSFQARRKATKFSRSHRADPRPRGRSS